MILVILLTNRCIRIMYTDYNCSIVKEERGLTENRQKWWVISSLDFSIFRFLGGILRWVHWWNSPLLITWSRFSIIQMGQCERILPGFDRIWCIYYSHLDFEIIIALRSWHPEGNMLPSDWSVNSFTMVVHEKKFLPVGCTESSDWASKKLSNTTY